MLKKGWLYLVVLIVLTSFVYADFDITGDERLLRSDFPATEFSNVGLSVGTFESDEGNALAYSIAKFSFDNVYFEVGEIEKAELVIIVNSGSVNPLTIDIHRITQDWDRATFGNIPNFGTSRGSTTLSNTGSYNIDITDLVIDWMNTGNNNGILIKEQNENTNTINNKDIEVSLKLTFTGCSGCPDVNGDNNIGIRDLVTISTNLFSGNINYDLNGDGRVRLGDLVCVRRNFGVDVNDIPDCNIRAAPGLPGSSGDSIHLYDPLTPVNSNQKDTERYNNEMVFMVSDHDPFLPLMLNPVANWPYTGESCNLINYGTPKCSYPLLIYHEETRNTPTYTRFVKINNLEHIYSTPESVDLENLDPDATTRQIINFDRESGFSKIEIFSILEEMINDAGNYYDEDDIIEKGTVHLLIWDFDKEEYIFNKVIAIGPGPGEFISWGNFASNQGEWHEFTFDLFTIDEGKYELRIFTLGDVHLHWGKLRFHIPGSEREVISDTNDLDYLYKIIDDEIENIAEGEDGFPKVVDYTRAIDAESIRLFSEHYREFTGALSPILIIGGDELHHPKIRGDVLGLTGSPSGEQIDEVNLTDFWTPELSTVVYVTRDYDLALQASQYASLINAPLIVEESSIDYPSMYRNKDIKAIGRCPINTYSGSNCQLIATSVDQAQQEIMNLIANNLPDEESVNKMILVNPNDIHQNYCEEIEYTPVDFHLKEGNGLQQSKLDKIYKNEEPPHKYGFTSPAEVKNWGKINYGFCKDSVTAPILASVKDEIIVYTNNRPGPTHYIYGNTGTVDDQRIITVEDDLLNLADDIKDTISTIYGRLFTPEYFTVIGSPIAIPFSVKNIGLDFNNGYSHRDVRKSLDIYYTDQDNNFIQDLALGRIFGQNPSVDSSYIARAIFLTDDQLNKKRDDYFILAGGFPEFQTGFLSLAESLEGIEGLGKVGCYVENSMVRRLNPRTCQGIHLQNSLNDYKKSDIILMFDHGQRSQCSIYSSGSLEKLKSTLFLGQSCLTSNYYTPFNPADPTKCKDTSSCEDLNLINLFSHAMIKNGAIGVIGSTDNVFLIDSYKGGVSIPETMLRDIALTGELEQGKLNKLHYERSIPLNGDYVLIGDPTVNIKTSEFRLPFYDFRESVFSTHLFDQHNIVHGVTKSFDIKGEVQEISEPSMVIKLQNNQEISTNPDSCNEEDGSLVCVFNADNINVFDIDTIKYEHQGSGGIGKYSQIIKKEALIDSNNMILFNQLGHLLTSNTIVEDGIYNTDFYPQPFIKGIDERFVSDYQYSTNIYNANPNERNVDLNVEWLQNNVNVFSNERCFNYGKSFRCNYALDSLIPGQAQITFAMEENGILGNPLQAPVFVGRKNDAHIQFYTRDHYDADGKSFDLQDRCRDNLIITQNGVIGVHYPATPFNKLEVPPQIHTSVLRLDPQGNPTGPPIGLNEIFCGIDGNDVFSLYSCYYEWQPGDQDHYRVTANIDPLLPNSQPFSITRDMGGSQYPPDIVVRNFYTIQQGNKVFGAKANTKFNIEIGFMFPTNNWITDLTVTPADPANIHDLQVLDDTDNIDIEDVVKTKCVMYGHFKNFELIVTNPQAPEVPITVIADLPLANTQMPVTFEIPISP